MTLEEAAFTLVTGLSGRLYLSGYLNRMEPDLLALVAEAVRLGKRLRTDLASTIPCWPLGLPGWDDPWVALGVAGPAGTHLFVWSRDVGQPETVLDLTRVPGLDTAPGAGLEVEQVFPLGLAAWTTRWESSDRTLRVSNEFGTAAARVFRIGA
jgi:alpha-galactosidase